ncbi:MAG: tRNA (guanosine(37)-N1)-methyltransferase TrmD [Lachnospiraceae bacterium]|nr:tRNA (guanosine(37)-N1)-methyltransferase TrmD [Lachnospiraceae bacterium]
MKFHVLTLFPEMIGGAVDHSILKRAADSGLIEINAINIRDYSADKHKSVDDYPYGGGAGMVMQAQPVYDSWESIVSEGKKIKTIYLTPQGQTLTQDKVKELSEEEELILLCGHYEGIDERVLEEIVDEEISVGDYVLTGGELPAVMIIDAVSRLIPGVLHNDTSAGTESFENGLLEYPQYTRPETWHEKTVPKILLSGDHKKVDEWREEQSIERTKNKRPDLYDEYIKSGIQ